MTKRQWSTPEAREIAQAAGVGDAELAIRKLARRVLVDEAAQSVPVPLQKLFGWANIRKVKHVDTVLEGGLTRTADGFEVILRAESAPSRKRFSLAHELGHVLFYKHAPNAKAARQATRERAPEEEERLCNVAAEEFLMPDWYLTNVASKSSSAAAMAIEVMTSCQVSASAALFRIARYWPHPGEIQLWRRQEGAWERSYARQTGGLRSELADFVVEAWGDRQFPEKGLSRTDSGFIYSPSTRRRRSANTTAQQPHGRADLLFVSLELTSRSPAPQASSLEHARRDRVRRAIAAPALKGCQECEGTGWVVQRSYDPARRLAPAELCSCRYDKASKVSA